MCSAPPQQPASVGCVLCAALPFPRRVTISPTVSARLRESPKAKPMPLIGYMRVSKVDGSQVLDQLPDRTDG
jgi:hypothetical protein